MPTYYHRNVLFTVSRGLRLGKVVGSVTVDCRKSWNDINHEWDHDSDDQLMRMADTKTRNRSIHEEEKRLHEERLRIENAQRQLREEADKLARERKKLQVPFLIDQTHFY